MKLMYFLMDRDEQREKRLELEFEVSHGSLSSHTSRAHSMSLSCVAVLTWCVVYSCVQVSELETVLEKEQQLGRVLQCSLQGRVVCHCCLSALVPTNVSTSRSAHLHCIGRPM